MRILPIYEKKQRGCQYCADFETERIGSRIRGVCPFEECPYHVLDKYESYEAYMASEDSKILVDEFFSTASGAYELMRQCHTPNRTFSDGDHRIGL